MALYIITEITDESNIKEKRHQSNS